MRQRSDLRDETGAALVIALIFITVVAVVTSVVLSFSDASLRATVELRKQASAASTADGAAQVAINALRKGSYTNAGGQGCFGAGDTMLISDFPTNGAGSVFVDCSTDETSGTASAGPLNSDNTPSKAILTLGRSDLEGISVTSTTNAVETMQVMGGVHSNSRVDVNPALKNDKGDVLKSDTSVTATTGCSGEIVAPIEACSAPAQPDPGYPEPAAPPTQVTAVPACPNNQVVPFSPGLYTDGVSLTKCDKAGTTLWFRPGTYYFDFAGKNADLTWRLNAGSVVGGTLTSDTTVPGTCVSPLMSTTPAQGVQFVFGGESQLNVNGTAEIELCGSYSASSPPIAVYGLKSSLGGVSAPRGCVIDPSVATHCPLFSSSGNGAGIVYVQGTVYAPLASVELSYRSNGKGQFIKDGIIVNSLKVTLNDVNLTGVEVPVLTAGPKGAETGVLLKVYVCPSVSTCNASTGKLGLETKVGVSNPAGSRTVKIYSWSVQR